MLLHSIEFKVAGVTYENEEGRDIQKEIKKILNEYKRNDYFDELYDGYTNSEIKEMDLSVSEYEGWKFPAKIVGDEYKGEECFKIYFKTYNDEYVHIGYSPKYTIEELIEWLSKEDIKVDGTLEVIGGRYKYCELYEEDYKEKERIATKELTYGIKISLDFYSKNEGNTKDELTKVLEQLNKEQHNQDKSYIDTKKELERQQSIEKIVQTIFWVFFIGVGIFIFEKIFSFLG